MQTLKTGDPCPCCGRPIQLTDPDALWLLTLVGELLFQAGLDVEEDTIDES